MDHRYPFELTLLIPTYNEEAIIGHALDEIQKALGLAMSRQTEVLIVDDGTDNLPEVVKALKTNFGHLEVLRNSPPLGKGASLSLGFSKARGRFSGFLDVDLSTPPSYIPDAINVLRQNQADIFIGSRKLPESEISREQFFVKDILGHILGVVARSIIFLGMKKYNDTQCGFKFFKNEDAKVLFKDLLATDGLGDLEVLIRANLMGYRVKEQGVKWTDLRESKRTLRRILFGELKAISKILWTYKLGAATQRKILKARYSEVSKKSALSF